MWIINITLNTQSGPSTPPTPSNRHSAELPLFYSLLSKKKKKTTQKQTNKKSVSMFQ